MHDTHSYSCSCQSLHHGKTDSRVRGYTIRGCVMLNVFSLLHRLERSALLISHALFVPDAESLHSVILGSKAFKYYKLPQNNEEAKTRWYVEHSTAISKATKVMIVSERAKSHWVLLTYLCCTQDLISPSNYKACSIPRCVSLAALHLGTPRIATHL